MFAVVLISLCPSHSRICFIGTLLSLVIFREMPKMTYFISLAAMAVGAGLCAGDEPIFKKKKKTE